MNRLFALIGATLVVAGCADRGIVDVSQRTSQASPTLVMSTESPGLTVMTWNVYYGIDPSPLLTAPQNEVPAIAAGLWADLLYTNFPARAGVIARAIAAKGPDLVGLQEAAVYRIQSPGDILLGGSVPATQVVYDFVALLIDSLAARGLNYSLVAADSTTDIEVPAANPGVPFPFEDVRLTDRDAVLARVGVGITNPQHAKYSAFMPIAGGVHEGWSSVEATVGGRTYRFVSTHLEIKELYFQEPGDLQVMQAEELIALLQDETLPTIIVGDFNSDASGNIAKETPSYGKIIDAGFVDSWVRPARLPLGLTCCENDSLSNPFQTFDQRVDFIFARNMPQTFPAGTLVTSRSVVGDQRGDRTPSGLWPSDHGGVVASFLVPPVGPRSVVTE